MIYGLGTDIVEIARMQKVLSRYGERFAQRILCPPELARFRAHRRPVAYLAKRFAAKEAFSKALGTGIRAPANWHGVWVVNLRSGQPTLEFAPALAALLVQRGVGRCHLSLSDERAFASATVILESGAST
jgi:holo-[acyl-carrier protein] synthase